MEHLLKTSAIVAIFYLIYLVFLQRETFFENNRWFLLMGLFIAFLLPFLVIPIYIEREALDVSGLVFTTTNPTEITEKPFNVLDYLPIIYGLGILFFTIRFLIQFASLVSVILRNKPKKTGVYKLIESNSHIAPFSFFNWIVYNPASFNTTELEQIMTHEKVHANQKHSFDILLVHLSCIVLWFSPFIWLYSKILKQNLEFIADKETATQAACIKTYQYTLLKASMPKHQIALSNNFYNSSIKKRIVMLHKSKSKKINQLKHACIIPVLGLFLMSFNTYEVYVDNLEVQLEKPKQTEPPLYFVNGEETLKENAESINPENIASINVLKGEKAIEKYGEKGKNGVVEITMKENKKWETRFIIGEPFDSISKTKNSSNKKTNEKQEIHLKNGDTAHSKTKKIHIKNNLYFSRSDTIYFDKSTFTFSFDEKENNVFGSKNHVGVKLISKQGKSPLYFVNRDEVTEEEFNKISPDDVASVTITKDEDALKKYGDKGKYGAVRIMTKNYNPWEITVVRSNKNDNTHNINTKKLKVLYIIDGKEVKEKEFKKTDTNNIKNIKVLKEKEAIEKYGDSAKDGVVEMTTKKND